MKILDLFKQSDLITARFFLVIFAAASLLTIGCSGDKTLSNSPTKTATASGTTASPTPRKLSSADAIAAFEKANLEIVSPHPIENADKINVEIGGRKFEIAEEIEGMEFFIPSTGKNMRGRVFSYTNAIDATETTHIYQSHATISEYGSNEFKDTLYWSLNYKNLMVQISRQIPQKKAKLYFDALQSVK